MVVIFPPVQKIGQKSANSQKIIKKKVSPHREPPEGATRVFFPRVNAGHDEQLCPLHVFLFFLHE
jgi:hypothetical protein